MKDFNLKATLEQNKLWGLRINLAQALYFSDRPAGWRADVFERRETKSGHEGTPRKIFTLVTNDGESPADLLRSLATLYEQGEVKIGGTAA